MAYQRASSGLVDNMIRAARLQKSLYAEIKANTVATTQAIAVVGLVGLAHGVGGSLRSMFLWGEAPIPAFVVALLAEIVFWAVASSIIYFAGRFLFGARAHYGQALQAFGFACVPGLLIFVVALASLLHADVAMAFVFAVLVLWRLAAGFVAVRETLSLSLVKSAICLFAGVVIGLMAVGSVGAVLWPLLD